MKTPQPSEIQSHLLKWFDVHGRKNLPWQSKNSYYVWVSEIMLQQTQVIKVIDYFNRFINKFPSLNQLAQADESGVLQLWSGLGYYNRARNLHKAAIICQQQHHGQLPVDLQQLMALPGIGRTTAGAVLSLASNLPFPIMDGNVKRVMSRLFMIKTEKISQFNDVLWAKAESCMEQKRAKDYNQALMDLGSLICTRNNSKCKVCPFTHFCQARIKQQVDKFPQKNKTIKKQNITLHTVMFVHNKQVWLQQRSSSGIWPQLWFLPCYATEKEATTIHGELVCDKLKSFKFSIKHILTHRNLQIDVRCMSITSAQKKQLNTAGQWIKLTDIQSLPHPKALEKIMYAYKQGQTHAPV